MPVQVWKSHEIPDLLTPWSFPLQNIAIIAGTKKHKIDTLLADTRPDVMPFPAVRAKVHKNTGMAPKTKAHFGMIYPAFYAGPESIKHEHDYGFAREHKKSPFDFSHKDPVHHYTDMSYITQKKTH
jgi:hypothetical protein